MPEIMPVLWKYDTQLGIAFFCPHCKSFQCTGSGACTECGGEIDWSQDQEYKGKVKQSNRPQDLDIITR